MDVMQGIFLSFPVYTTKVSIPGLIQTRREKEELRPLVYTRIEGVCHYFSFSFCGAAEEMIVKSSG